MDAKGFGAWKVILFMNPILSLSLLCTHTHLKKHQNRTKMNTSRLWLYLIMGRMKGLMDALISFNLCWPNKLCMCLWNCSLVLTMM